MEKSIEFELTYSALKMFGKQLYSNVGSAISELVANGLDAKAKNVYVAINIINKEHATVEILDNGIGMSVLQIQESYIKIGYNKRKDYGEELKGKTMGRKGIGKLAALYLSDNFTITTKKEGEEATTWKLDVSELGEESKPQLMNEETNLPDSLICADKWKESKSGTYIYLNDVNMKGLGEKAFEAMESRLSNYFLYDELGSEILINIVRKESDKGNFTKFLKKTAFNNMAYIINSDSEVIDTLKSNNFIMKYKDKLGNDRVFVKETKIKKMSELDPPIKFEGTYQDIHYKLTGWIGIHCSIDGETARDNDERYMKNQFYNPNQLRVYVRNKLALANMIEHLGITRAFVNYIEGEVSFDILDDDRLEDIATAGRQDFDTQDERFDILRKILTQIGNLLVRERQLLADEFKKKQKTTDESISAKSKKIFARELSQELDSAEELSIASKNRIEQVINNKVAGDIEIKGKFTVFISHASKDRIFGDFIYFYLKSKGFKGDLANDDCEIFYSSSGLDTNNLEPLSKIIKDTIVSKSNDMLFITSEYFDDSQYCLFEGGAAWATRSISEYKILALDYGSIPTFLTNGKGEVSIDIRTKDGFEMDTIKYNLIIDIINRLVMHLNKNREILGEQEVPLLARVDFPDNVILAKESKTVFDYMDEDILIYWNEYVVKDSEQYIIDKEAYKNSKIK